MAARQRMIQDMRQRLPSPEERALAPPSMTAANRARGSPTGRYILKNLAGRQAGSVFHVSTRGCAAAPAPRTLRFTSMSLTLTPLETNSVPVDGGRGGIPWRHRAVWALLAGLGSGKCLEVSSKVSRRNALNTKRNP